MSRGISRSLADKEDHPSAVSSVSPSSGHLQPSVVTLSPACRNSCPSLMLLKSPYSLCMETPQSLNGEKNNSNRTFHLCYVTEGSFKAFHTGTIILRVIASPKALHDSY